MPPFYGWGSTVSSHYKEAVYFLPLSSQEFLVLNWSTSDRWKVELNLEPSSDFEPGTPGLGMKRLNHLVNKKICFSFGTINRLDYPCICWYMPPDLCYCMTSSLSVRPVNQLTKTAGCEVLFDVALYKVRHSCIGQKIWILPKFLFISRLLVSESLYTWDQGQIPRKFLAISHSEYLKT